MNNITVYETVRNSVRRDVKTFYETLMRISAGSAEEPFRFQGPEYDPPRPVETYSLNVSPKRLETYHIYKIYKYIKYTKYMKVNKQTCQFGHGRTTENIQNIQNI